MGIGQAHAVDLLEHIFHNLNVFKLGDAYGLRPSVSAGSLFASLHTAAPVGPQNSNEATYAGYTRVAVPRAIAKWTLQSVVVGSEVWVVNADDIAFPTATDGPQTLTHVSLGQEVGGASVRMFTSALAAPIVIGSGDAPNIAAATLKVAFTVDDP